MLNSSKEVLRAFIIGAFDCKGAYDKNNLIALDYKNAEVACLIRDVLQKFNLCVNLNDGVLARLRENPNATPRASQLRVNYITYITKFGYISNYKYKHTVSTLSSGLYTGFYDSLLANLKIIDYKGI